MAFCWNMNLVVSTMALARSPPDKQQCTEICFFFFFFYFPIQPDAKIVASLLGIAELEKSRKKPREKAKQVERISIFFWRGGYYYYLSGGKKGSIAQCDSL
jgi:hypothetical protein